MTTRREAVKQIGAIGAGTWHAIRAGRLASSSAPWQGDGGPALAPGAPMSAERRALIDAFTQKSAGLDHAFESHSFKGEWVMPYRLYRPKAPGRVPLVIYLHGSGGLGDDNERQMALGNTFGTRVWALPENQRRFPCFVAVPQTDRGWVKYGLPAPGDSVSRPIPGLGDGAALAFQMIDALCRDLPIDMRRIYLTGQSMGGRGTWHMTARRPKFFAAAVACCPGPTFEPAAASALTPIWNFHGDADGT